MSLYPILERGAAASFMLLFYEQSFKGTGYLRLIKLVSAHCGQVYSETLQDESFCFETLVYRTIH